MMTTLPQACERCWRRKQKCARDFPCSQCRTASAQCVRRRLGSFVDSTSPGAESYIEALKHRIRTLQLRLDDNGGNSSDVAQVATPSSQPRNASDTPEYGDQRRPRSDIQDAMQEASYLSLSAMAERTDKHRSSINGLSFMTLLNAALAVDGANPTVSSATTSMQASFHPPSSSQQIAVSDVLISREDSKAPFQAFTNYLQRSYPFMTVAELEKCFDNVFSAHEGATINHLVTESPEVCLLTYVGIATGLLLSSHYAEKEQLALNLAARGRNLLSHVFDQAYDLGMVQSLLILTIHSMFTAHGGSTWHLLGLAMTRCIASGMHTSKISNLESEDEGKRQNARALWSLYMLDAHVGAALDRPFCLSELDIMVSLPSSPVPHAENTAQSYLVQHAQLIRSFRRDSRSESLCNFINLQHWNETQLARVSLPQLEAGRLLAQGYIEMIKTSSLRADPDHKIIFDAALTAFGAYHGLLEEYLHSRAGAPSSLEALNVFAAGVILTKVANAEDSRQIPRIHQAINILTLLSTRYSPVRWLRDILLECLMMSLAADKSILHGRVGELIENCEVIISQALQAIALGPMLV